MNLLSIFTREEPVGGLEISETHLRLAFLAHETPDKKGKRAEPVLRIKALVEEPLPEGVIQDGEVRDQNILSASLIKLLKKSPRVRYFVVSIPGNKVYQKIFKFPQTVADERLLEAMKLATTFQLPFLPETAYIDWEKLPSKEENDVFLAAVLRTVIEQFIPALARAGVKTVAIETRGMSLGRILNYKDQTILIRDIGKRDMGLYILRDRVLRFARTLPSSLVRDETSTIEIEKMKKFYEVEWKDTVMSVVDVAEAPILPELASELKRLPNTGNAVSWKVALGAAFRGILPRSNDTIVSILPVGTEEAYEYQKAAAFTKFIAHTTIGLSIFWVTIFFGAWILLSAVQENSNKELAALSQAPISGENVDLEDRAKEFDDIVTGTHSILATFPQWSTVLDEVRAKIIPGISVTMFSLPASDGIFSLNGSAATRADLNKFKKSLEGSALISEVNLPITNLERKTDIPFSATFRLRDPGVLFVTSKPTL